MNILLKDYVRANFPKGRRRKIGSLLNKALKAEREKAHSKNMPLHERITQAFIGYGPLDMKLKQWILENTLSAPNPLWERIKLRKLVGVSTGKVIEEPLGIK